MIHEQLKRDEFRFIRIKPKEKIPFEKNWQKTGNYKHDSTRLENWFNKGGNYGVLGGYGNLIIIDFDNEDFEKEKVPLLPKTFSVMTGTGRLHKYFICDDPKSFKVLDSQKNTLADVQGIGKQVIGPGSTHPNGNQYSIVDKSKIARISLKRIQILFSEYLKEKDQYESGYKQDLTIKKIKEQVRIVDLLKEYNYDISRNPTMCILGHDSKSKSCFTFNESKDLWYCFHCDKGGDIFSFVMEHEKTDFLNAKQILMERTGIKTVQKNFMIDDYLDNVNNFWEMQPFFYDKAGLFWFWNKESYMWEMVDETDIMTEIDNRLNFYGQTIRKGVKNNYLEAFKRVGRKNIPKKPDKTWIQFKNQIFDYKKSLLFQASHKYYVCNPIPWKIGDSSDTPTMDKLFFEWVGEGYVQTLYEIIAYCCLTCYPIHLIFCFVGSGRNGKSSFQKLLTKFIGLQNVASTELDIILDSRFETTKLYKKLVCTLGETNFGVLNKTSLLKRLTGQDLIGFEFKNKQPFDDYNYAKIMINSNSLPSSEDTSEGFYRRWMIIDFNNQFGEGKDIVDTIPEVEYENLAFKVTDIVAGLMSAGLFTNQGSIEERQKKYILSSNPLSIFLDHFCKRRFESATPYSRLYNAYCKFLIANKRRVVSRKEFSNVLIQEGLEARRTFIDGERDNWIEGIEVDPVLEQNMQLSQLSRLSIDSQLAPRTGKASLKTVDNRDNRDSLKDSKYVI